MFTIKIPTIIWPNLHMCVGHNIIFISIFFNCNKLHHYLPLFIGGKFIHRREVNFSFIGGIPGRYR
jgi:hypothetical protein